MSKIVSDTSLPSLNIDAQEARRSPVRVKLTLSAAQRDVLAQDNGLVSVDSFALQATGLGMKGQKLRVEGQFTTDVTYLCGVSLKPYSAHIEVPFDQLFARDADLGRSVEFDPLDDSDIEPLQDGEAQVARLAYELFTLALDPYPRHPGLAPAEPEPEGAGYADEDDTTSAKRPSPFAVLKGLKQ